MGVATKHRRKIVVGQERYLWEVAENRNGPGMVLHVLSPDKDFIAMYQLRQPPGEEYIVILGRRFAGAATGGTWKRFYCPNFVDAAVTPAHVRKLIEWCLDETLPRRETTWRGPSNLTCYEDVGV